MTTDYLLGKDATTFENQLTDLAAHDYDQIQKYLGLSQENKLLADIMLDSLHDQEQKSGTENPTIKKQDICLQGNRPAFSYDLNSSILCLMNATMESIINST
ncbi:hypothetical protein, partial [Selenomonas ruminantium]|uniref:hypothetical protein n=1 Tax=Selenomonas ruminantium TaxID=971 RepID=UPI0026F28A17